MKKAAKPASKTPAKSGAKPAAKSGSKGAAPKAASKAAPKDEPAAAAKAPEPVAVPPEETTVGLKQVPSTIMENTERNTDKGKRWPLLVDPNGAATTFLRYRDINYLNACNPGDLTEEKIRLGILGGLRYGKPFVIDTMDSDMFHVIKDTFDKIEKDLLASVLNKTITDDNKFMSLVKESDDSGYQNQYEYMSRMERFVFVFITSKDPPFEDLAKDMWIIRLQ